MTWTSDSRRLALVSAQWVSTDVTLWDTETGRLVLTLSRKGLMGQNQRSLRFSPDNHRLLHIADDNRIEGGEAWDNPSTHPIHIWDGTPLKGSDPAYKDADQIHGGKTKDDKLDSEKIARLIRGGTFPLSYVYLRQMRATRDLVRRRMFLVRRRSELLAHVQLINQQCNCEPFEKMLKYAGNRDILDRFTEDSVRLSVEADLQMVGIANASCLQ